jgi:septum formation protein
MAVDRSNGSVRNRAGMGGPTLLLASRSPRRRTLLTQAGIDPIVWPVDLDETPLPGETPVEMVCRLAEAKARAALARTEAGRVVLAADTAVIDRGAWLGKPADEAEAVEMLMDLSGRSHEVVTALSVIRRRDGRQRLRAVRTDVRMRAYSRAEAAAYAAGGSPLDKAGGYGIQDRSFHPVDLARMDGCFTNVMGLPLCALGEALHALGVDPGADLTAACLEYHPHDTPAAEAVR